MVAVSCGRAQLKSPVSIGIFFYEGKGVIRDYKKSFMWFEIAAINGESVSQRERVAKKMSSEDVSKAQDMARERVENH